MRYVLAVVGVLALAGCQTTTGTGDSGETPLPEFGTNTGHLSHGFSNVRRSLTTEPGYTDIFTFDETFRNRTDVTIEIFGSQICYAVTGNCVVLEYDFTIGPNQTVVRDSSLLSYNPASEAYTETYHGEVVATGTLVTLTVTFRASLATNRPAATTQPAPSRPRGDYLAQPVNP